MRREGGAMRRITADEPLKQGQTTPKSWQSQAKQGQCYNSFGQNGGIFRHKSLSGKSLGLPRAPAVISSLKAMVYGALPQGSRGQFPQDLWGQKLAAIAANRFG